MPAPAVGGVQHVLLELRLQLREFEHGGLEPCLAVGGQTHAGEAKIAHGVLEQLALDRRQCGAFLLGNRAVGPEQRFALRQVRVVRGQERQAGVVAGTQRVRVEHRVQMAHGRPGARHPVVKFFERLDHAREGGGGRCGQLFDAGAVRVQQFPHRRLDMLGTDLRELRQRLLLE